MSVKRYSILFLTFFILLNGVALAEAPGLSLTISETAVVSGPRITLADLGTIQGGTNSEREYLKKIDLGAAPIPGQVRPISKKYILEIIMQHQFLKKLNLSMGAEVKVTVEAVCIKKADIEKVITDLLQKAKPGILKKWIELNNIPKEIWLSNDNWELKAVPIGKLPELGTALFKVIISNKNEKGREINISGKIRETAILYRTIRELPRHAEIKPDDLETVEMELSSGKELLGEIKGRIRTKRLIRQGEVLRTDQIQPVPLVHKEHEVVVIVRSKTVEITTSGIAKADGWLGDEILVVNPKSKKNFRGRVINENMVEVIIK